MQEETTSHTDGEEQQVEDLIDFRQYLLTALFLIKFKEPVIQLIELAFKVRV